MANVPVGFPAHGTAGSKVAVIVTGWKYTEGFGVSANVACVPAVFKSSDSKKSSAATRARSGTPPLLNCAATIQAAVDADNVRRLQRAIAVAQQYVNVLCRSVVTYDDDVRLAIFIEIGDDDPVRRNSGWVRLSGLEPGGGREQLAGDQGKRRCRKQRTSEARIGPLGCYPLKQVTSIRDRAE